MVLSTNIIFRLLKNVRLFALLNFIKQILLWSLNRKHRTVKQRGCFKAQQSPLGVVCVMRKIRIVEGKSREKTRKIEQVLLEVKKEEDYLMGVYSDGAKGFAECIRTLPLQGSWWPDIGRPVHTVRTALLDFALSQLTGENVSILDDSCSLKRAGKSENVLEDENEGWR